MRKLEEQKDVGKALSPEEELRLLDAASRSKSKLISPFIRIVLGTGMRAGEITSLRWGQVDFEKRVITVGRAKTSSGTGRQIPMHQDLFEVLSMHAAWFTEIFGCIQPDYCLFPFGKGRMPQDPSKPVTDITSAWHTLKKEAGVNCRLHDLRHTAATKMAEAGVAESTMLSIMGHMSRAMLERYSHIKMEAKRTAVEALSFSRSKPAAQAENTNGVPKVFPKVEDSGLVQ